jgi:hypothetical protein
VNGSHDKQALNSAQQNLQAEKNQVAQEARDKAERERQIRLAEKQAEEDRRAEQRRLEREEADSAPTTSSSASQLEQSQRNLDALFSRTNKQLQDNTNRAFQQKREQADARQREANEARAAENERIHRQNQRVAQQEQDRTDQQARSRQANSSTGSPAVSSSSTSNMVSQPSSPTPNAGYGEVRKKTRCIMKFNGSGTGPTEEVARANALKMPYKDGGPDNRVILSHEVVSCRVTGWGYDCLSVTKVEGDFDMGRGADGTCARGIGSGISQ